MIYGSDPLSQGGALSTISRYNVTIERKVMRAESSEKFASQVPEVKGHLPLTERATDEGGSIKRVAMAKTSKM